MPTRVRCWSRNSFFVSWSGTIGAETPLPSGSSPSTRASIPGYPMHRHVFPQNLWDLKQTTASGGGVIRRPPVIGKAIGAIVAKKNMVEDGDADQVTRLTESARARLCRHSGGHGARLERRAMASRHQPRTSMSSEGQTRRSNRHHEACRWMEEPLAERVLSRERDH